MIREAVPGDESALDAWLSASPATTMFLRGNLRDHGLAGSDHPHASRYILHEGPGGIAGVAALTNGGNAMAMGAHDDAALWQGFVRHFAGRPIVALTGAPEPVRALRGALAIPPDAVSLDRLDPQYLLTIDEMRDPGAAVIRSPGPGDRALLADWFRGYEAEAVGTAPGRAAEVGARRAEAAIAPGSRIRLLTEDGAPVAMAGFNAHLPDIVQVGGVWTPPALRRAGRAGRLIAAMLREAARGGVRQATLFAASPGAARVYERIGFRRIGDYAILLMSDPVTIGAPR
ncbi:GNAT family N-acetyltransferase [Rhodobacterales bacterium HKCCE2091]|nr:GNAT family N-acetyltransferase [Rhodobacterales bacterium HKCCE2091]